MIVPESYLAHSCGYDDYLAHHGIKGMHWGIRRFQNADGSLTSAGRSRYGEGGGGESRGSRGNSQSGKSSKKARGRKAAAIAGAAVLTAAAAYVGYRALTPAGLKGLHADAKRVGKGAVDGILRGYRKADMNARVGIAKAYKTAGEAGRRAADSARYGYAKAYKSVGDAGRNVRNKINQNATLNNIRGEANYAAKRAKAGVNSAADSARYGYAKAYKAVGDASRNVQNKINQNATLNNIRGEANYAAKRAKAGIDSAADSARYGYAKAYKSVGDAGRSAADSARYGYAKAYKSVGDAGRSASNWAKKADMDARVGTAKAYKSVSDSVSKAATSAKGTYADAVTSIRGNVPGYYDRQYDRIKKRLK